MKKQMVVFNGSYRARGISFTFKAMTKEAERLKEVHGLDEIVFLDIPDEMVGCRHCAQCEKGCRFADEFFKTALAAIEQSEFVMLGSPVYLDFPAPKMLAFLSRLVCMSESTQREFFRDKKAILVATALCSGTKAVIQTMMGACEMLGMDIPGRSTKEYIQLWKDKKIRGGMTRSDACFLE